MQNQGMDAAQKKELDDQMQAYEDKAKSRWAQTE
jgi:hypothetical protein